jgi:hypothetical protein
LTPAVRTWAAATATAIGLLAGSAPAGAATQSFSNTTPMVDEFNDGGGALLPYPSVIDVGGMSGTVTSVQVTIRGSAYLVQKELYLLLAGPGGRRGMLMGNACGNQNTTGSPLTITFTDAAPTIPMAETCMNGSYSPQVHLASPVFVHPFSGAQPVGFSQFTGAPPNGSWQLYANDFIATGSGSITAGWTIELTTIDPTQPAGPKKCKKAKGKRAASSKKKRCKKRKKKK